MVVTENALKLGASKQEALETHFNTTGCPIHCGGGHINDEVILRSRPNEHVPKTTKAHWAWVASGRKISPGNLPDNALFLGHSASYFARADEGKSVKTYLIFTIPGPGFTPPEVGPE